jgi:hypothetical protein
VLLACYVRKITTIYNLGKYNSKLVYKFILEEGYELLLGYIASNDELEGICKKASRPILRFCPSISLA